jgi:hypothetical protein
MQFTVNHPRHYLLKAGDTLVSGHSFDDCGEVSYRDGEDWVICWRGKPQFVYAVTVAVQSAIEKGENPAGLCFRWSGNRVEYSPGEFFRTHA